MITTTAGDCFDNSYAELDGRTTITPESRSLDSTVSESFKREAMQVLGSSEYPHISIDLRNVTDIDGSGLGSLLYILRQVTAIGRKVTLEGVTDDVRDKLAEARIDKLFKIIDNDINMLSVDECLVELAV